MRAWPAQGPLNLVQTPRPRCGPATDRHRSQEARLWETGWVGGIQALGNSDPEREGTPSILLA